MEDFRVQWNKVDNEFFNELLRLHNKHCMGRVTQEEFNTFVIENRDKIDNPDYLQIFSESISIHTEFFKENFEMCKIIYYFMVNNVEWIRLPFNLRDALRLGLFQDSFEEYLEERDTK